MMIIKVFKFELIKIIVFLFLSALSILFVTSSQDKYYNSPKKPHNYTKDSVLFKTG